MRMTLGDRRNRHRLDDHHANGISPHRKKKIMESVSEKTFCSFQESKSKGGEMDFQHSRFYYCNLIIKIVLTVIASYLDYLEGLTLVGAGG